MHHHNKAACPPRQIAVPPARTLVAATLAVTVSLSGCNTSRAAAIAPPPESAAQLPAITTVRIAVINFTGDTVPFALHLGALQLLDTVARAGTLNVPVHSQLIRVAPGDYRVQLLDRRSQRTHSATLTMGGTGKEYATVEVSFDDSEARLALCHCVRMYTTWGGPPSALPITLRAAPHPELE